MWQCPNCDEPLDNSFELCWKCQTSRPDNCALTEELSLITMPCPRCGTNIEYRSTKSFQTGDFFTSTERFDIYACPTCGRAELFVSKVGRKLRSKE